MKIMKMKISSPKIPAARGNSSFPHASGFSLLELLAAMAVFLIVGGAAVSLFSRHVPLFTAQQNQTAVNIALRNAAAQLQIDVVNAGTGYYQGINIPSWPIGVTVNHPTTACYNAATHTYGAGCFDSLNIITIDPSTPPANPNSATSCVSTTSSTLFGIAASGTITPAQLASYFHAGDELLLVKNDGSQMATIVLTQDGSVSGGKVQLSHNKNLPDGTIDGGDPLNIANAATAASNKLGTQFCNNDWILKVSATTYSVDATDPTNPRLVRQQGVGGAQNVIADQVIGFRVGAYALATAGPNAGDYAYEYDPANYNSDWATIRSVRVSMIGRTNPVGGSFADFHNSFDNGPYKVEGISIVVNPRNLSMNN